MYCNAMFNRIILYLCPIYNYIYIVSWWPSFNLRLPYNLCMVFLKECLCTLKHCAISGWNWPLTSSKVDNKLLASGLSPLKKKKNIPLLSYLTNLFIKFFLRGSKRLPFFYRYSLIRKNWFSETGESLPSHP